MRRGLVVLLFAAAASAQDADYGAEALRARAEALRPDVEAVLGVPFGEAVEVRVTTREDLRDILVKELVAIQTLGLGNPPEAKDVLLKALGDENPRIRSAAVFRLGQWAEQSRPVVEAILRMLDDESDMVRSRAARELGEVREAVAVPALVRLLDDESVREDATVALGRIGIADPEAMRKLETLLDAPDLGMRFEVARALRQLGRDPKDLVPVFVETLRKGKDWDRDNAAEELGLVGEAARPHIGDLVNALKDKDLRVREKAAKALGNLGAIAKEALPALEALGGAEEEEKLEVDEDGNPVIGLGGGPDEADVRRAAREAAGEIRATLARKAR